MDLLTTIENADDNARVAILHKNGEDIFPITELKTLLNKAVEIQCDCGAVHWGQG